MTSTSAGAGRVCAGRGRPRRPAAAVVAGDDLVAALLLGDTPNPARAGPTPVGAGSEQKAAEQAAKKEQKKAEAAAKKAAKQAEAAAKKEHKAAEKAGEQLVKETIREEQKEQKAAEKAEKLAAKQAEAAEKKAAKKAEQAKKVPGALLRAAKKAAKAEKAQKAAAPGEQVCADELREEPYAPDEPGELEVHVRVFEHEGVRWLKDDDHLLYCPETHDEVGRWDPEQQAVCF